MSNLPKEHRDYLAELTKANEPVRSLLHDAGREINYLRTVIRDLLPYLPIGDHRVIGFSEAAALPKPKYTEQQKAAIYDKFVAQIQQFHSEVIREGLEKLK